MSTKRFCSIKQIDALYVIAPLLKYYKKTFFFNAETLISMAWFSNWTQYFIPFSLLNSTQWKLLWFLGNFHEFFKCRNVQCFECNVFAFSLKITPSDFKLITFTRNNEISLAWFSNWTQYLNTRIFQVCKSSSQLFVRFWDKWYLTLFVR